MGVWQVHWYVVVEQFLVIVIMKRVTKETILGRISRLEMPVEVQDRTDAFAGI
jgi:hypothetical protein